MWDKNYILNYTSQLKDVTIGVESGVDVFTYRYVCGFKIFETVVYGN